MSEITIQQLAINRCSYMAKAKTAFTLCLLSFLFVIPCMGQATVTYDITFKSIWNTNDHTTVPSGAHWSKLVGATHKTANTFLQTGSLATTGIKNVAEFGSNTNFNTEVSNEITTGEADQYINGPSLGSATGDMLIADLVVKKDFPLLTLISMIAPSPDWIINVNSHSLLDGNGNWKTSEVIDVFAYDAGTDSGADYTSYNSVTNPFQAISKINGAPINGNKMGTLTITLKTPLFVNAHTLQQVKAYPNQVVNGKINLINLEGISVSNLEIYNASGSRIKTMSEITHGSTLTVNIPDAAAGIYFIRLTDKNEDVIRKFLVR